MADLYSEIGQNARSTAPSSEMGTPKITPVILNANGSTLPNGETVWAPNDTDEGNYLINSEFRAANSTIFRAIRALQEYVEVYEIGCTSDSSILTVMCRDSSIPYNPGDTFQNSPNTITILETAVRNALFPDGQDVIVEIGRVKDDDTEL